MTALESNQTEINTISLDMVEWLTIKYEKRLAIYPRILSDPIYQHTTAAKRLRVLDAAIEILRGGRYLAHIKIQLIEDLREEKNKLFELFGKRTHSIEMYENIINHLKTLEV